MVVSGGKWWVMFIVIANKGYPPNWLVHHAPRLEPGGGGLVTEAGSVPVGGTCLGLDGLHHGSSVLLANPVARAAEASRRQLARLDPPINGGDVYVQKTGDVGRLDELLGIIHAFPLRPTGSVVEQRQGS